MCLSGSLINCGGSEEQREYCQINGVKPATVITTCHKKCLPRGVNSVITGWRDWRKRHLVFCRVFECIRQTHWERKGSVSYIKGNINHTLPFESHHNLKTIKVFQCGGMKVSRGQPPSFSLLNPEANLMTSHSYTFARSISATGAVQSVSRQLVSLILQM